MRNFLPIGMVLALVLGVAGLGFAAESSTPMGREHGKGCVHDDCCCAQQSMNEGKAGTSGQGSLTFDEQLKMIGADGPSYRY